MPRTRHCALQLDDSVHGKYTLLPNQSETATLQQLLPNEPSIHAEDAGVLHKEVAESDKANHGYLGKQHSQSRQ